MSFYGKDGGASQQGYHPDPRIRQAQAQNSTMYGGYGSGVPMPGYGGAQDPNAHGGHPPGGGLMGSYNEYNQHMMNPPAPSPYVPEYYGGNQNYSTQQVPDSSGGGPRPHINPSFLPGEKAEPTKILRNPYPSASSSKEAKGQRKDEAYDPSCPTLTGSAINFPAQDMNYGYLHQHSQAHNPSSGMPMVPPPTYGQGQIMQQQSAYPSASTPIHSDPRQMPSYNTGNSVTNDYHHQAPPTAAAAPYQDNTNSFNNNSNSSGNQVRNENTPAAIAALKIMTGLVTQIQAGGFGMISEEIFFQQSTVSGSMPKVGDKVVVEAEAVNGMPFKYNAKKVTKLDMDLVNEEKGTASSSSAMSNTGIGLAPLPTLPDSLNLPKPSPPGALKSILKRNPPPPPVISKTGASAKSSSNGPSSSSFKSSAFSVDLNRDIPRVLPPSGGPAIEFPEYNYVRVNIPEIPARQTRARAKSPQVTRLLQESPEYYRRPVSPPPPERRAPPLSPTMQEILDMNAFSRRSQIENHGRNDLSSQEYLRSSRKSSRSRSSSPKNKKSRKYSRSKSPSPKNKKSRKYSRSRSPSPRSKKSRKYSRSRSISPKNRVSRRKSRSKSPYGGRRSRSRSPKKSSRRNRSRSPSPPPKRERSRTPERHKRSKSPSRRTYRRSSRSKSRERKKSRSPALGRYRRGSRSTSRDRKKSRSPLEKYRRGSRSVSRDRRPRSPSPGSHRHRSRERRSDKRGSKSNSSPNWRKRSSSSSIRSVSPGHHTHTGLKVHAETVTQGIVFQKVVSDLFPKIVHRDALPVPTSADTLRAKELPKSTPVPIKFQISNPSKPPPTPAAMVPNPTFTSGPQATQSYYNNSMLKNITKTVVNPAASAPSKQDYTNTTQATKGKKKEQEPAFKIIDDDEIRKTSRSSTDPVEQVMRYPQGRINDDKIKQWEHERQALKNTVGNNATAASTAPSTDTLLKNPVNILHLKQTIQNDLNELRQKSHNDPGKKLLENPVNIEQLKQSVQRDLSEFKKNDVSSPVGNNAKINDSVSEGLKQLRSRFDSENKVKDQSTLPSGPLNSAAPKKPTNSNQKPIPSVSTSKTGNSSTASQVKDKNSSDGRTPKKYNNTKPALGPNAPSSSDEIDLPPYDEDLERMQEEIHQQRFMEEQHRLRAVGDEVGLQQLFYMEDRRRRRLDERNLARLRLLEIQLKKDKKFSELQRLRSEWGPSAQRFEQERILREARKNEEKQQGRLGGQAQAIRMHEMEYQQWLEEEAAARLRERQQSELTSRGFEGRVLRRRTPSPASSHGHRDDRSSSHDRHSHRDDWDPRGPPPPHQMGFGPPPHADFFDGPPHPGYFDERARMEEEMMHRREMEMRHRMEMEGGFPEHPHHGRGPPPPHREDYTRFVVPRH